jgi:hypothetical protein
MGVLAALSYRNTSSACARAGRGLLQLVHPAVRASTGRAQRGVRVEEGAAPAPDGPSKEEVEWLIVTARLTGVLEPGEYQAMMARLARLDEARIQVRVPEIRSE